MRFLARPARSRQGFTLIELMVALVISGIVVGVVFQLLLDQGRFVRYLTAREEVQQNTRAALDLIASELRGVPPGGIEAASQNSLTVRVPRLWGTVCERPTATTTIRLAVPAAPGINYSVGSSADTQPGLVVETSNPDATLRVWSSARVVSGISGPSTTCNGRALEAGLEMRTLTVAAGDTVGMRVGRAAYLYDRVTYAPGTSTVASIPGLWIRRRVGTDAVNFQPLAGPIRSLEGTDQGLSFRYLRADGTPIPSGGDWDSVTRIEVSIESISTQRFGASRAPQAQQQRMSVALRNRP